MEDTLLYGLSSLWVLLVLFKRLRLKEGWIDTLLIVGVLITISLHFFSSVFTLPIEPYFLVSVGFLYTLIFVNPLDFFNRDRYLTKFQDIKKEHQALLLRSESLRKRFIALIDLLKDGLAFKSDDGMMFATENLCNMIGFSKNEFALEEFEARIHPDDLSLYKNTLKKLTKRSEGYEISYRFKKFSQYIWLKEIGSLVYYEDRTMIISMVKSIDVRQYPETAVDVLNSLKIDQEMLETLQSLNRQRKSYYLVVIELSNIPSINKKYGRDIGDLMMGDFLNKMRFNFVKEDQAYFRISGIRFAMVIQDPRKYEILERALKHGGDALNFSMQFGGIKETLFPYFGIQKITMFDEPINELIERTIKALEIALDDHSQENYFVMGK